MFVVIYTSNRLGLAKDFAGAGILTVCRCQLSDRKV